MAANDKKKEEEAVHAYEPDKTLRDLIGKDTKLEEIFTPQRIAECQKTIDDARDHFFERASADITFLEGLLRKNAEAPDQCEASFEQMAQCVGNLKGQAEMFGFRLVGAIANHIADCCEPKARSAATRIRLASDLVRMLGIAVRGKVTDETGTLGRELKASLGKY